MDIDAHARHSAQDLLGAMRRDRKVSAGTVERAGRPFGKEPVRTFDAVHLATIEALGEAPSLVTVLTRDERVRANAAAMGFVVA